MRLKVIYGLNVFGILAGTNVYRQVFHVIVLNEEYFGNNRSINDRMSHAEEKKNRF